MYDIDHYLQDIRLKDALPADELIVRTVNACQAVQQKRQTRRLRTQNTRRLHLAAIPAAAFLAIGILIGAFFFAPAIFPGRQATAYYTVDINPSILLSANESGQVINISGQNEEAREIIRSVDATGRPVTDALLRIIEGCRQAGYLQDAEKYVLIGYFGDESQKDQIVGNIQNSLEQNFGEWINLLMVTGSLADKQLADELHVSPGLLKLSRFASNVTLSDQVRITDLIEEVGQSHKNELQAPAVAVSLTSQGILLTWTELDFAAMGYTGKVSYQIVTGQTAGDIDVFAGHTLGRVSFYTNQSQPLEYLIQPDTFQPESGQTLYFAIYVHYHANLLVAGPAAVCQMPVETGPSATPIPTLTPEPTVTPEPTATPVPTATPKPTRTPTATPKPTSKPTVTPKPTAAAIDYIVKGQIEGDQIRLLWTKETAVDFSGYKIVASKTNEQPSYPDDGYLQFITDPDSTSIMLSAGQYGLEGGERYYFSVTWLYKDNRKIAGNAVLLEVPVKPTPSPEPYLSTQISGSIADKTVSLSWDQINHSQFDGYKVMYSFSDSEPVYGDGSPYAFWITQANDTERIFDVTELNGYSSGATVYFSISVLYDSHKIIKPGNVITFAVP